MKYILFGFTSLLLLLGACSRNDKPKQKDSIAQTAGTKVLVLCEGNFQWNNADFDVYVPDSQKTYSAVFASQNQGFNLGDVLQSGLVTDSFIYLVLNNSGKIVVLNRHDYTLNSEIKGFKSPRFAYLENNQLLVSDLYDNQLAIADLGSKSIAYHLPAWGWTESICKVPSGAAVASYNGKIYWIDHNFTAVVDSTDVHKNTSELVLDKNNKLWALAGDSGKLFLSRINASNYQVEKVFVIEATGAATRLAISNPLDSLYFIGNGIMAMSVDAQFAPTSVIYSEKSSNFYGLGVDPFSGNIYVSNAKDFVSKGEVLVLSSSGKFINRFNTGINPSGFLFYR